MPNIVGVPLMVYTTLSGICLAYFLNRNCSVRWKAPVVKSAMAYGRTRAVVRLGSLAYRLCEAYVSVWTCSHCPRIRMYEYLSWDMRVNAICGYADRVTSFCRTRSTAHFTPTASPSATVRRMLLDRFQNIVEIIAGNGTGYRRLHLPVA